MKKRKIKIANKEKFLASILLMVTISLIMIGIFTNKNKVYSTKYEEKYIEVTINKGDTLWSIALNYKPDRYDTREIVYEIMIVNDLKDSNVIPGDIIKVPIKTNK